MVEAALSAPLIALFIGGLLSFSYLVFAKVWIRQNSYEAVICLAEHERAAVCRDRLASSLERVLNADVRRMDARRSRTEAKVRFEVRLLGGLRVREERVLRLPLRPKRGSA